MEGRDMPQDAQGIFTAGPLSFVVKHELWDENIQDHADQGVAICVTADVTGRRTILLRFNCFDIEKSYIYGPENTELAVAGPEMLGGSALTNLYRMDPIACGNPIGWTIRTLDAKLPKMLERAGCPAIATTLEPGEVREVLPDVEACAGQQDPAHLSGPAARRGPARLDLGAVRRREIADDAGAGRLSRRRGRSRRRQAPRGPAGDEETGARDVGRRRKADRPPRPAARSDAKPRRRRVGASG